MPSIYTLAVTPEQVTLIGNALAEMPFKMVASHIQALQAQINDQNAAEAKFLAEHGSAPAPEPVEVGADGKGEDKSDFVARTEANDYGAGGERDPGRRDPLTGE